MKFLRLKTVLSNLLYILLFLLPWQTIWILKEPFVNGSKWEYGVIGFYATELLLWLCAILFIFWYWSKAKLRVTSYGLRVTKDRIFTFSCFLFTVYCLLSILWSPAPDLAWQQGLRIMAGFILFFILWLGPITFQKAAGWFVFTATLQSVLGIWQFLTQSSFAFKWLGIVEHPAYEAGAAIVSSPNIGRWLRAYASFSHPNIFGGYLVISLVFTAYLLLTRADAGHTGGQKNLILYYTTLLIQISALFFTFSRSAWLTFLVFLIVFVIINLKVFEKKIKSFISPIILLLLMPTILSVIFWPLVQTRFIGQSYNEVISTEERLAGYGDSLILFKKNPLLGAGAGNYTRALMEIDPTKPGWAYQPTHNVPLLVLTELGLLGLILLLTLIITFTIFLRSQKLHRQPEIYLLFTVYCLLVVFDHYMYSSFTGLILSGSFFGLILLKIKNDDMALK